MLMLLAHSAWRVGLPGYFPPDSYATTTAPEEDEEDAVDGASAINIARVQFV